MVNKVSLLGRIAGTLTPLDPPSRLEGVACLVHPRIAIIPFQAVEGKGSRFTMAIGVGEQVIFREVFLAGSDNLLASLILDEQSPYELPNPVLGAPNAPINQDIETILIDQGLPNRLRPLTTRAGTKPISPGLQRLYLVTRIEIPRPRTKPVQGAPIVQANQLVGVLYSWDQSEWFVLDAGAIRDSKALHIAMQRLDELETRQTTSPAEEAVSHDEQEKAPPEEPASKADPTRNGVFVSYSHGDARWLERLRKHLRPLEREGVEVWDDTRLQPGKPWREEIRKALSGAKVAILLISADFLASEFIVTNELPPLLKAAEDDGATILPVIISHSRFERTASLSRFQAVNDPRRPLVQLRRANREKVLDDVARAVEDALMR